MSAQDDNPSVGGDGDSVAELNARLEGTSKNSPFSGVVDLESG